MTKVTLKKLYKRDNELITPNKKKLRVFAGVHHTDSVPFQDLQEALGYLGDGSIGLSCSSPQIKKAIVESNVTVFESKAVIMNKPIKNKVVIGLPDFSEFVMNFIHLCDVSRFVESLLRLLKDNQINKKETAVHLLEWLKTLPDLNYLEFLDNFHFEAVKKVESKKTIKNTKEELQMTDTVVTMLTIDDIKEIKLRAEALKEAFDVTKKDALRAVVQLKSEEINRNLAPLIEMLKCN